MILGADTVTIVRPAPPDRHGDPSVIDSAETVVTGCSVQPRDTDERTDLRDTVTDTLTLYAPATADIAPTDRVRWRSVVYQVDGRPMRWVDLGGADHHLQVQLRRVEG